MQPIRKEYENFLKRVTVRIKTEVSTDAGKELLWGSGVIYKQHNFLDYVYVFTAKHCFYGNEFQHIDKPIDKITVWYRDDDNGGFRVLEAEEPPITSNEICFKFDDSFFQRLKQKNSITEPILMKLRKFENARFFSVDEFLHAVRPLVEDDAIAKIVMQHAKSERYDFAALKFTKDVIGEIYDDIPESRIIENGYDGKEYISQGYPNPANFNENVEVHFIPGIYNGSKYVDLFKFKSEENLADFRGRKAKDVMQGFSGSGVFIRDTSYLAGIVDSLESPEYGIFNVLYCQNLAFIKEILPDIKFYSQNITTVGPAVDHSKYLRYEDWAQHPNITNPRTFVTDKQREEIINQLQTVLMQKEDVSTPHFRIVGLPGSGKTRLMFEALRHDDLSYKVMYIQAEALKDSPALLHELRTNNYLHTILVVDDCKSMDHEAFVRETNIQNSRLALITLLYPTSKDSSQTFRLDPLPTGKIKELLLKEFPNLSERGMVIEQLANFSDGYPNFAIQLAQNVTSQLSEDLFQGNEKSLMNRFIAGNLEQSSEWFRNTKRILTGLALFAKVGYKKQFVSQAQWIATSEIIRVKVGWHEFREIILEQKRRNVIQGEYYLNISPFPLAIHLFREWIETHGEEIGIETFIKSLPQEFRSEMLNFFAERIPFIPETPCGREFIKSLFSEQGLLVKGLRADSALWGNVLVKLTEVFPETTLAYLRSIIDSLNKEDLQNFSLKNGKCRWAILYSLQFAAIWKELFDEAARLLLMIGELEDQEQHSYGTRQALVEIFEPAHKENDYRQEDKARTAAALPQRFSTLKQLFQIDSLEGKKLVLEAFQGALKTRNFSSPYIVNEYSGIKQLPTLWKPKGSEDPEILAYYQDVWEYLDAQFESLESPIRELVVNTLLDSSLEIAIVQPGLSEMLYQTIVKMESYHWIQRDTLLKHVSDVVYFAGEQLQEDILDKWKNLQDQLTGSDFPEQLKRYIGMELHEGFFPNDLNHDKDWVLSKVHEFAEKAISNPTQLEMAYSWLTTKQIGKIYYFGYELGNLDDKLSFLEQILEEQRKAGKSGSSYFMTGYLNALSKRNEGVWENTIDRISKDEILGKYISILVPINDKEVKRLLSIAKETHSVEIFKRFRYQPAIKQVSETVFIELLTFLLQEQPGVGIIIAFDLHNFYYVYQEDSKKLPKNLTLELLLHSVFWRNYTIIPSNQGFDYHWKNIANVLLKQYPETEELLLTHVVKFFGVKESIAGQIQNYAMEEFLSEIATRNPEKTWQEIVKYLEPSLNWDERTFALTKWLGGSGIRRKNMLKIFNPSDIWEWIDKDIDHRARYIASLVPTIFEDNVCLARELLIKYGDRKNVRAYLSDACINKGYQFDKPLPEFQKNETNPNVKKWLNELMGRLKGIEES